MKGLMKILEAVIAVLAIFVAYIVAYGPINMSPGFDIAKWRELGFEAIKSIDKSSGLRADALSNSTASIENKIRKFIPINLDYLVIVCNLNCTQPNVAAQTATSVEYIFSGTPSNYAPRQVIVFMWLNE